jgi:hypothetical protein
MRVLLLSATILTSSHSTGAYWQSLPAALEQAQRRIWYTAIASQPKLEPPPVVIVPPKPNPPQTKTSQAPPQPKIVVPQEPKPLSSGGDRYDRTAQCESGMQQNAVSKDGQYLSYFQWLPSTWHSVGGSGDPRSHSYAEQKARAQTLSNPASQWPVCWAKAG